MSKIFRNYDDAICELLQGKSLSGAASHKVFKSVFKGELRSDQTKTLLLLLSKKGESVDEVGGCLKAIKELEPAISLKLPHLMDTCGTGGDNSHSFNISTVSAFVIAGAGGKVAKHGNRSISSKSGSSDLMKMLGVKLDAAPKRMIESMEKFGIGYFHAPFYHPVFAKVQALRQQLKVRTIFNLLGPLLNPFKLKAQLVGVANKQLFDTYTGVIKKIKSHKTFICHSNDGMDEITTSASTLIAQVNKGQSKKIKFNPTNYGFTKARKSDYAGGTAVQNSKMALRLLQNKIKGPLKDIVVCNAGAGLFVSGVSPTMRAGMNAAKESIEQGKAYASFMGLKKVSNKK